MCVLDVINAKRDEIRMLAQRYKAEKLWVFGSCARREEHPTSDIDFIADFVSGVTLFDMADFQYELQKLFNRSIDIITAKSLKQDSFGKRVRAERIAI